MLERYFVRPDTLDRIRGCWIGGPIERYVADLAERGYSAGSVVRRAPMLVTFGAFAVLGWRRTSPRSKRGVPFFGVAPAFFEFLGGERGLREATVRYHAHSLRQFEEFLARVGCASLDELSPPLLSAFATELAARGLASSTPKKPPWQPAYLQANPRHSPEARVARGRDAPHLAKKPLNTMWSSPHHKHVTHRHLLSDGHITAKGTEA